MNNSVAPEGIAPTPPDFLSTEVHMAKLLNAVQSGDKRQTLVELRDEIAQTIESCESGRDMAALSKRLMEVIEEIESIDARSAEEDNPLKRARSAKAKG